MRAHLVHGLAVADGVLGLDLLDVQTPVLVHVGALCICPILLIFISCLCACLTSQDNQQERESRKAKNKRGRAHACARLRPHQRTLGSFSSMSLTMAPTCKGSHATTSASTRQHRC